MITLDWHKLGSQQLLPVVMFNYSATSGQKSSLNYEVNNLDRQIPAPTSYPSEIFVQLSFLSLPVWNSNLETIFGVTSRMILSYSFFHLTSSPCT